MTYKIIAAPIKGQKITKQADSIFELHDIIAECKENGWDIKDVSRTRRVVQLKQEPQLA